MLALVGAWIAVRGLPRIGRKETKVDISLLPVSFGGKCGYVDSTGKIVINPQYDNAMAFDAQLNVAPVFAGDKWGLIDRDGKYVVNPQFDTLNLDPRSHTIAVQMAGKSGTIDQTGKFIINPQFDYIGSFDTKGHAIVRVGDKWGIVDSEGKFVVPAEYDDITADEEARADDFAGYDLTTAPLRIERDQKFGFLSGDKLIVAPQFVWVGSFGGGDLAAAAIEETDNVAFKRIRDQNAAAMTQMIRNNFGQFIAGDIQQDDMTLSFSLSNPMMFDSVNNWLGQNLNRAFWTGSWNVNRNQFGFVTAASFKVVQTLAPQKRNKVGFIDKTGKFVISPQFDNANGFSDSGMAAVQVGNVYGYADRTGKLTINPQWTSAQDFKKVGGAWLAVVGLGEEGADKMRFGVIDLKGAYKISPQFDGLSYFDENGLAIARVGEHVGAIDLDGHYVLQPVYNSLLPIAGTSEFVFVKPIAGAKDVAEIGVVDRDGKVITTVRGGTCAGIYSFQ